MAITLNFNDMVRLSQRTGDNIIVKNGEFHTTGRIGAFFTSKTAHRRAGEALLQGIRQNYGDTVADTLAVDLRAVRTEGKPLSARMVRDSLDKARSLARELARVNEDMARHFFMGSGLAGDTRNLDTAFAALCASRGLDPATHQHLKDILKEGILRYAQHTDNKLLSFAELGEIVRNLSLPGMRKAFNIAIAQGFLNDPGPDGVRAATDALVVRFAPDTPAQEAQLRKFVKMAVMCLVDNMATDGLSKQDLFNQVASGELPGLDNFAFACGKGAYPRNAMAQDTMCWANARNMIDLSLITLQFQQWGNLATVALATQNLEAMRRMQPEGTLTRETLWKGCFQERMPQELKDVSGHKFSDAMLDRLCQPMKEVSPELVSVGLVALSSGLSMATAVEALRGPVTVNFEDIGVSLFLTPRSQLGSLKAVEESMAKDIHRRVDRDVQHASRINIGRPNGETETVRLEERPDMSEQDKADFHSGKPSSISHRLVTVARELCAGNDLQARQVILSMGQSATRLMRALSPVTGVPCTEHAPIDLDIHRADNGNVIMRFHTPDASPLDMDYTYVVTPDGVGSLSACRAQARAANAQPAAAQTAVQDAEV